MYFNKSHFAFSHLRVSDFRGITCCGIPLQNREFLFRPVMHVACNLFAEPHQNATSPIEDYYSHIPLNTKPFGFVIIYGNSKLLYNLILSQEAEYLSNCLAKSDVPISRYILRVKSRFTRTHTYAPHKINLRPGKLCLMV
jgi:hypothetical protein